MIGVDLEILRIKPNIFMTNGIIIIDKTHQDFTVKGFPMIEIYSDRIEISNSGTPLVTPDRFIDGYI